MKRKQGRKKERKKPVDCESFPQPHPSSFLSLFPPFPLVSSVEPVSPDPPPTSTSTSKRAQTARPHRPAQQQRQQQHHASTPASFAHMSQMPGSQWPAHTHTQAHSVFHSGQDQPAHHPSPSTIAHGQPDHGICQYGQGTQQSHSSCSFGGCGVAGLHIYISSLDLEQCFGSLSCSRQNTGRCKVS
jgi:hypothetical protein